MPQTKTITQNPSVHSKLGKGSDRGCTARDLIDMYIYIARLGRGATEAVLRDWDVLIKIHEIYSETGKGSDRGCTARWQMGARLKEGVC